MELYQLEQFRKAAELSHITKAAEILSISQPALSKTIHLLEKELGYSLFDHIGKHISLNENGRLFLKYVNDIFYCLENAKRELQEKNQSPDTSITLCVKAASKLIPEILLNFSHINPDARFSVSQFSDPKQDLRSYDFTLTSSLGPANTADSCTLLREELLLALPATHHLARETKVELSELKGEPFIGLQKGMGLSDIMNHYCQLSGFSPTIVFESDSPSTLRSLIHLGLGIAFIPQRTWPGLQDETIRLLPIRSMDCCRYINLLWDSRRYLSAAALNFKEYLIQYFSSLQNASAS